MSASARLLGPIRLGDTEGVAQGRYAGLQVELRGLRQVRLLAKVIEVKERGAALHLSLHQSRRSDLHRKNKLTIIAEQSDPQSDAELSAPFHTQRSNLLLLHIFQNKGETGQSQSRIK